MMLTRRSSQVTQKRSYLLWIAIVLLAAAVTLSPLYLSEVGMKSMSMANAMHAETMPPMPDEHDNNVRCLRCVFLVSLAPELVSVLPTSILPLSSISKYQSPLTQRIIRGLAESRAPPN